MKAEERCQEHMVADGEIERSIKKDGLVERTRRCGKCGALFKSFEMTDDKLAGKQVEQESRVLVLQGDVRHYRQVVKDLGAIYDAERNLRYAIEMEHEFGDREGN